MMPVRLRSAVSWLLAACLAGAWPGLAPAAGEGVVATVNDQPITTFDIDQRIRLLRVMGRLKEGDNARKRALQSLIDDVIKRNEARKYKLEPTEDIVNKQIERMAKGFDTDVPGFTEKLRKQGLAMTQLKSYVAAQIAFSRWLQGKGQGKVEADQAEIDRRYAEIMQKYNAVLNDPRMRPVTVYEVQEIEFPVEQLDDALLQARAVEARLYIQRFSGCKSARAAAQGIFNVQVGKLIQADGAKLPKALKAALDRTGPGHAFGPARSKGGLQVIGFCGKRTVAPPKPRAPSREAIENIVRNQKFDEVEERHLRGLRQAALIDYKDPSDAQ